MRIRDEIGDFCAEGRIGLDFLNNRIVPVLDSGESLILDFEGVRNMNSSFSNALFANLIRKYGTDIIKRIVFKNIRENVKKAVVSGLSFGLED